MRGATAYHHQKDAYRKHFNPRAPCGARQEPNGKEGIAGEISIHAPHAGRDSSVARIEVVAPYFNPRAPCGARPVSMVLEFCQESFQSTRPMRGATEKSDASRRAKEISIHAPHAGRDRYQRASVGRCTNFNPRAPCGARRVTMMLSPRQINFNPRAPCGARQIGVHSDYPISPFQSTRPMRGATRCSPARSPARRYFNPRAPCGARQQK